MTEGLRHFLGGAALGFILQLITLQVQSNLSKKNVSVTGWRVFIFPALGGIAAWGLM